MRNTFLIVLALTTWTAIAQGPSRVPAYHGVIQRIQPDGDTLHVYLRGDERGHYMMTVDGWQVMENKKGTICYAIQRKNKEVEPSCRVAHDSLKRGRNEKQFLQYFGIQKKQTNIENK